MGGTWPMPTQSSRLYRVIAHRIDDSHPGAKTLTNYAQAISVEAAAVKVRRAHERPGGLYGVGLYRIVKVEEADQPASESDAEEQPATSADATAPLFRQSGPAV